MKLDDVKKMADIFLHLPMKDTKFSPTIVYHPFFESAFLCDDKGIFNAVEEKDRYTKFIEGFYNSRICKCNTVGDIMYLIRKPYRLSFLKYLLQDNIITLNECGNLLADTWTLIEVINNDANVSKTQVLKWISNADKDVIMSEKDLEIYNMLPDTVVVYRGVQKKGEVRGISWTTDKEKGKYFATRYNDTGVLCKAIIRKEHIIAYTDSRDEKEIILNYRKLENISFTNISR